MGRDKDADVHGFTHAQRGWNWCDVAEALMADVEKQTEYDVNCTRDRATRREPSSSSHSEQISGQPGGLVHWWLVDSTLELMGDPACALGTTCLSCGRVLEVRRDDGRCPHCGEYPDGTVPGTDQGQISAPSRSVKVRHCA